MIKIKRLLKSFIYAVKGLRKVFREEQNLRLQTAFGMIAVFFAWFFRVSPLEWIAVVFAVGLVIIMEILNSAVERVSDVLKPRINSYVKEIKDIMAAAVMFASFIAVIVGLIVFWPHIIAYCF